MRYLKGASDALLVNAFIFFTFAVIVTLIHKPNYTLAAQILFGIEILLFLICGAIKCYLWRTSK